MYFYYYCLYLNKLKKGGSMGLAGMAAKYILRSTTMPALPTTRRVASIATNLDTRRRAQHTRRNAPVVAVVLRRVQVCLAAMVAMVVTPTTAMTRARCSVLLRTMTSHEFVQCCALHLAPVLSGMCTSVCACSDTQRRCGPAQLPSTRQPSSSLSRQRT
jgi:hypothetical protein